MTLVVREEDARECRAAGFEPEEAVRLSLERSDEVYEARSGVSGELFGLWGLRVVGFLTLRADMWLLTSEAVAVHPTEFARTSKTLLAELLLRFNALRCEVFIGYADSIKWLKWLGFKPIGRREVNQNWFLIMEKGRD